MNGDSKKDRLHSFNGEGSPAVRHQGRKDLATQGLRYRTDEEVEELLQFMKASIREEMRAEMSAELAELEARLSQSRGPLTSDLHSLLRHLTLAVATGRDMTRLERVVMIQQARLILIRIEEKWI